MSSDAAALRIVDASLNRAGEGLRVVEDYVRFALDDALLTEHIKQLRHDLAAVGASFPAIDRHAVRDTVHDVGTAITTPSESLRASAWSVCAASLERVKQSLRSLEEYAKVAAPSSAGAFESLRYRLYTFEAALGRTADAIQRLAKVQLCVLIDGRSSEAEFESIINQLVAAGVDAIQLRDKRLSDRELILRAQRLRALLQPRALPGGSLAGRHTTPTDPRAEPGAASGRPLVIVNDRPDIAAIVDADGVHLGQEDMPIKEARAIVGSQQLIGVSVHSIDQAREAVVGGANYLGVGPTFPSKTKEFAEFPGLALLRQVAAEIRLPAFAIGGIDYKNIGDVIAAGFSRVAVGSAVTNAVEPLTAAAELRAVLTQ